MSYSSHAGERSGAWWLSQLGRALWLEEGWWEDTWKECMWIVQVSKTLLKFLAPTAKSPLHCQCQGDSLCCEIACIIHLHEILKVFQTNMDPGCCSYEKPPPPQDIRSNQVRLPWETFSLWKEQLLFTSVGGSKQCTTWAVEIWWHFYCLKQMNFTYK